MLSIIDVVHYLYNMHKTCNVVWQWDMANKDRDIRKIQRSEMRMLRWMTGMSLSERKSNEWVRSMLAIDDIAEVMQRNRLGWFGYVERRDELCWIKRIETLQVDGDGVKGRPRKRWREVLKEDMRKKGLCRKDAWDRWRWRKKLWEGHRRGWPKYTGKNNLVKITGCCCCCWCCSSRIKNTMINIKMHIGLKQLKYLLINYFKDNFKNAMVKQLL